MKIFCIGYNKTGTTSLWSLMKNNNISVAECSGFESNVESYFNGNYDVFMDLINKNTSDPIFFQDVPFSFPFIYKTLDKTYPGSKFILTVRDNENEWYGSLRRFYAHMFPHKEPDWIFRMLTETYKAPKNDIYNEKNLKNSYLNHIKDVENYFKNSKNFIKINLKDHNVIEKIENLLGLNFKQKVQM